MINISEIVAKTEATKIMFCDSFQPQQKPPLHSQLLALQWRLFVRTFEVVTQKFSVSENPYVVTSNGSLFF